MKGIREHPPRTAGLSPELNASILSLLTWHWINPLVALGNIKTLQTEDLYELNPEDTTLCCEQLWKNAISDCERKISLWSLLFRSLGKLYFMAALWKPLWLIAVLLQVYVLKALVRVAENHEEHLHFWWGMVLVLAMFLASTLQSVSQNNLFNSCQRISMRARSIISMAIFNKMLSLKQAASSEANDGGMVLNLLTNDTQKLVDAGTNFHFVWFAVVEAILVCSLAISEAGIAAVPGVIFVILSQSLPVWMGWAVGAFRRRAIHFTDKRVRLLGEILSGIKTVKHNGWTTPFLEKIGQIRKSELKWIGRATFVKVSTSTLKDGVIPFATMLIFGTYSGIHGESSSSLLFTVLALLNVLSRVLNLTATGVQCAGEALVAAKRIEKLLTIPNVNQYARTESTNKVDRIHSKFSVLIMDGWFSWVVEPQNDEGSLHCSKKNVYSVKLPKALRGEFRSETKNFAESERLLSANRVDGLKPVLKSINISVQKGKLIGITGSVGSGKSSFLLSLLGETQCLQGVCLTENPVAYVPQQPWILNDSFCNNVLFGSPYDASRYHKTIAACALNYDVAHLPATHDTEIGERGVNLSGGQKARISLARACYSDAPLVLLDDPFSSIDACTVNHLVQHVLHGFLKGRTVILSTHNKNVLESCDETYLISGGKIQAISLVASMTTNPKGKTLMVEGTQELNQPKRGDSLASLSIDKVEIASNVFPQGDEQEPNLVDFNECGEIGIKGLQTSNNIIEYTNKSLTVKEDRSEGLVTWPTFITYLRAGRFSSFVLVMVIYTYSQVARIILSYWLAAWSDKKYQLNLGAYIGSYACILFVATILSLTRAFMFSRLTTRAAKVLHCKMADSVFSSPLLFFEQNPLGRILNRLSKDQAVIDDLLPNTAQGMLESLFGCLGSIAMMAVLIPWFLLALPLFIVILLYLQRQYTAVSRELKRLDGVSRSLIYGYFSQTLQGMTSIRAYGAVARAHDQFAKLIDENHSAYVLFLHVSRWLGFRLDFSATFCVTITALFVVLFHHHMEPGIAGIILVQSLQFTGLFQYGVRMAADTETHFTNVERVCSYVNLPPESDPSTSAGIILENWPSKGEIEFINYTMAYREGLAPVLQNISFKVRSQEKIGILGRTGAGKSSLALALCRMVENKACSGCILIDGVNIKLVDVDYLRQCLTIIPQDPVLFKETIRVNLDPFEQHTDSEIYEALTKAQLRDKIQSLKGGLHAVIKEKGNDFSVGECQLLCLARFILRRSKILVMDEATAAVDAGTSELIQAVLHKAFQNHTVLIIAHRIDTIVTCNRLLVLSHGGQLTELDCPENLLKYTGF